MKRILYLIAALSLVVACSGPKGMVKIEPDEKHVMQEDSVEYELVVFDAGFETWYMLQDSPAKYRSQQYYETWNQQYVSAWNYNAAQGRRKSFFQPIYGYEQGGDYGFDLNHKLFYYFQYVEHVLGIEIMSNGPKGLTF